MNQRGLTLIEAVTATVLVGILAAAVMTFIKGGSTQVQVLTDKSALVQSLSAIERDIMGDMIFTPPQETDDPAMDSAMFDNGDISATRCYDRSGNANPCGDFPTNPGVQFRCAFYKVRVQDNLMPGNTFLGRLPVSRVRFRIEYKVANVVQPRVFFSRLETGTLRY